MDPIDPKAKQWIDENKDPRSAFWQAGLEAIITLFLPDMESGCLTPVHALEEIDLPIFKAALEKVDLSPGLLAAFLPPVVANTIFPPDSAQELMRIEKEKPSYKIIIKRPGKEYRMVCAEISPHAHRPGLDIFQAGALLGSFDYSTHDVCISELTKALRAHAWEKTKWQRRDYLAYTLNWFEKTQYLGKADVSVDENHSFFHHPSLIKTDRIDGLFLLIYETLHHRFQNLKHLPEELAAAKEKTKDKKMQHSLCHEVAQTHILDLLNAIKTLKLLDFTTLTKIENQDFKTEFVRTIEKVSADLAALL